MVLEFSATIERGVNLVGKTETGSRDAVAFLCCAALAAAAAWPGSTSAGGGLARFGEKIARAAAPGGGLTAQCAEIAVRLAETGIEAGVAARRPTRAIMRSREAAAIDAWEEAACPDRILPGIAFGIAAVVNGDERARRSGA